MPDHFVCLGLPRCFSIDAPTIEREYLARSRDVHPDFHTLGSEADQRVSLELSASLNEAYLALKDAFRRADYLLGLHNGPTSQQEKNLDQAFLMEMMDLRERIDAVRTGSPNELRELEIELQTREKASESSVSADFTWLESQPSDSPERPKRLVAIRRKLNAWKTIRSLLRDLRSAE